METTLKLIKELLPPHREPDYLLTWEKSLGELKATVLLAEVLQALYRQNRSLRVFESGLAVSLFRDNSTRTRFSFASACNLLGLEVQDLDEGKSQLAHGETVRETANMISFLTEVIGIRDDIFLGEGNRYMREVAQSVATGQREGVLPQRPAVINLQCDLDHPTQSLADLAHLKECFGGWEGLKGKKLAMTWAFSPSYGKPLSVPQGIISLMTRMGMDVTLAYPEGYNLLPEIEERAGQLAKEGGGAFRKASSLEEAFEGADVVYPKSWAPFSVMQERTTLLRGGDQTGLQELEKRCLANNTKFQGWECTGKLMKMTNKGEALYMHCLPADITDVSCKAGEVAAKVFDKYRVATYQEAGYKPFVIAAMILQGLCPDPAGVLQRAAEKNPLRRP